MMSHRNTDCPELPHCPWARRWTEREGESVCTDLFIWLRNPVSHTHTHTHSGGARIPQHMLNGASPSVCLPKLQRHSLKGTVHLNRFTRPSRRHHRFSLQFSDLSEQRNTCSHCPNREEAETLGPVWWRVNCAEQRPLPARCWTTIRCPGPSSPTERQKHHRLQGIEPEGICCHVSSNDCWVTLPLK